MEKELVLFSGGPDSTILLEYLLKQKKFIHVLYVQLGYDNTKQKHLQLQNEAVKNVLTYFRKKGHHFDYTSSGIFLDIPKSEPRFGSDDQWSAFFAGIVCRMYGIKKIWAGFYSYTYDNRKELLGHGPDWVFDGSLNKFIQYGTTADTNYKDIQYLTPRSVFNRTEIDSFKTKKEAFDSLDPELKTLVRSCYGDLQFCGECYKCQTYIHHGIKNKKGELL